jgi:trans-aconitate methyltransferase
MKLNSVERALMNNPVRAAHQHHREAAWFRRLAGGALSGRHVLEVGCGRGVGSEVILDRLGAERVTAFDLDDSMVGKTRSPRSPELFEPADRSCSRRYPAPSSNCGCRGH